MADRYIDRTNKTGDLTGTCTFTNGSTAVTGSGTSFSTELAVGDYVKPTGTNEWYYVSSIPDNTNLTLRNGFAQATQSGVVTNYADVSVNDGSTVAKAFVHPTQASEDEVRSAGDTVYFRRGQTHEMMALNWSFDENGTKANRITYMSDDGTGWPTETGNADAIIDLNSGGKLIDMPRNYITYKDLEFKNGSHSYGIIDLDGLEILLDGCKIHRKTTSGGYAGGIFYFSGDLGRFVDCTFIDCWTNAFKSYYDAHTAELERCTFDAGVDYPTQVGIYGPAACPITLIDCDFSQSTAMTTDLDPAFSRITAINCTFGGTTEVSIPQHRSWVKIMDKDDTKRANKSFYHEGTVERITTTVRTGGADSSLECIPNANTDTVTPFQLMETWVYGDGTLQTFEVWMLATGVWASLPTAAQLYLEAYYYDDADAGRAKLNSTEAITAEDTWTKFDVAFTPNAAGPVRLRVYLTDGEVGKKIIIDPLVVVS